MAGMRWNLFRTGIAAWCFTLAVAMLAFGMGPGVLAVSQIKALLMALDILPIVWGALFFYAVCEEAGAIRALGDGLIRAVPWKNLRALTLGWAFASFLQGAGGFGVPVVITAPLLLAAGFPPLESLILPFIGHAWAVTFGSLGASFQALMAASSLGADSLAAPSALLLGVLCMLSGLLIAIRTSGKGELLRLLPVLFVTGLVMAGTQYLLAVSDLWQVGSLGGGLAGLLVIFLAAWWLRRREAAPAFRPDRNFILGACGYFLLIVVILCAKWFGPVRNALQSVEWIPILPQVTTSYGFSVPGGEGARIAPFGHPGALLVYSAIVVFFFFHIQRKYPPRPAGRILRSTAQRAFPVSIGILLMVGVSAVLSYSGMTARLGEGLAAAIGGAFPAFSPWLGAAGAFLTGSNTNSNLMFAPLQQYVSKTLGADERLLLAAQTSGGALGSVLSPAKVGMGSVAFPFEIREGDILRRLLLPIGLLLAVAGAIVALLS
jgi:lactate permease